jgi:hypothetical protein
MTILRQSGLLVFPAAAALVLLAGCAASRPPATDAERRVTVRQIEELRSVEILLPITPDSIIARFERYGPASFHASFEGSLARVRGLIDSLNMSLDPPWRIDTLSIDHTMESFGEAACRGKTLFVSSSYFYAFADPAVLRAVITHEFGHVHFRCLDSAEVIAFAGLWTQVQVSALFYLFRDGEYSGNARFGGHPEESPAELFASAFNLSRNRPEEIGARLRFVDRRLHPLVRAVLRFVAVAAP